MVFCFSGIVYVNMSAPRALALSALNQVRPQGKNCRLPWGITMEPRYCQARQPRMKKTGGSCLRPEVSRAVSSCRKEALDTKSWTHFSKSPKALGWETPTEPERGVGMGCLTPTLSLSLENKSLTRSGPPQNTGCKTCSTIKVQADHYLICSPFPIVIWRI